MSRRVSVRCRGGESSALHFSKLRLRPTLFSLFSALMPDNALLTTYC